MRYCLITGSTGGIGLALAGAYSDAGYKVIATDISGQTAMLRCDYYVQADLNRVVNDEIYAQQIFFKIRQCLTDGGLKALVNNAAIQIIGAAESLTRDDWQQTLNVNLLAPFLFAQAFLPDLEREKGCVINISSIHAQHTKRNFIAYATSKAALSGLTGAMAVELGGRVRVIGIEPAAIETDMLRAGFRDDPEGYQQLSGLHPIGRTGRPEEVAKLAIAITDGGIDFLNGVCVRIDGGISARLVDPDISSLKNNNSMRDR